MGRHPLQNPLGLETLEVNCTNSNSTDCLKATQSSSDHSVVLGFSKKHLVILGFYGLANIFRAAVVLIGGALYPPQAQLKGASGLEIGIVFASQDFTIFCISFFYGKKILNQIGPERVVILSFLGIGICAILFGCTVLIEDKTLFVAASIGIRILNGFCDCGIYPAVFTIFTVQTPASISTAIALFEFFFGIGAIGGPVLCTMLSEAVGFTWTYATVGICIILSTLVIIMFVPKINNGPLVQRNDVEIADEIRIHHPGFLRLLTIPTVLLVIFSLSTTSASIGFVTATLVLHYDYLSLTMIGALFSTGTAVYTVACPIWGILSDRRIIAKSNIMILAASIIIIGYSVLGPLPFLPYESSVWTGFVGYSVMSFGIGGAIMTAYHHSLEAAITEGFPDDPKTYGLVSTLYIATFSLGNVVGPTVSGVLYDHVGFSWGTLFIIGMASLVILASILLKFFNIKKRIDTMR